LTGKIIIISEYLTSEKAGASYERIKCYAKALPEVKFLIINPNLNYKKPIRFIPNIELSNLIFIDGVFKRNGYFYRNSIKYFDFFRTYFLCRNIIRNYKTDQVKILLFSSLLPLYFWVIVFLKNRKKFTIIIEKNEMETGIVKNIPLALNSGLFFLLFFLPLRYIGALLADFLTGKAHKIIAISTRIKNKYQSRTNCYIVPLLVNLIRFKLVQKNQRNSTIKFVYLGYLSKNKDGIGEILRAVDQLKKRLSNFHLDIIGDGSKSYLKIVNSYIDENNLSLFVSIKQSIPSSEVPIELSNYDYALLVREKNTQTQYGFSTKLGEYLAAGLPVIFTDVSDNLLYLKDNHHGFLVPFPVRNNLANVLEKAIHTDYNKHRQMKENAYRLAGEKFDYRNFSEDLKKIFL